ncbi:MAG: 50S ribosomal protein L11 methyltransferase [Bacteroidetes bacterium]|nr:50S ribosomal protein L11 methyltransferase [Bacteroidota bacterium]
MKRNNAGAIDLFLADHIATDKVFDIILANITRNIILDNFPAFGIHLNSRGLLLLSGLLAKDEEIVLQVASFHQFNICKKLKKDNWIFLMLEKN